MSSIPILLGKVIVMSHVDTTGKQSQSVKEIFGVESKPVAGILDDPLRNFNISPIPTSLHSADSVI